MDLEKASVEEAFKQMRKRASRFMDMSSKFATISCEIVIKYKSHGRRSIFS
jgi:hypothetical protein